MKKHLFLLTLTVLFSYLGFSQELIQNGDFSLPADGVSYARIDSIPGWCTDATTGDENGREFVDNNAVAWAWDEGASIYQVIGDVPSTQTTYNVSLDATCYYSWWADYVTDLYVIFSSFTGTDTTNRTAIDSLKFTVSCLSADQGTFVNKTGSYAFEADNAHAGEHLAVEIKLFNSQDFGYGSSWTYLHYDNVSVSKTGTGVNDNKSTSLNVFPVPVKDILTLTSDKVINNAVLLDVSGKEIEQITPNDKKATFQVSNVKSGIYFIHVLTNDGSSVMKKIVVE